MGGRKWAVSVMAVAILLAGCGDAPAPSASPETSATPAPTPSDEPSASPSASPSQEPTPFPVRDSAEADALFRRPDTCTNPEVGYTVTFPDDWYTNTAIGDQAACTWFTPDHFEVAASGETPEEIWIGVALVPGIIGYNMLSPTEDGDEVEVDGYSGHWSEFRLLDEIGDPDGLLTFHYVVPFHRAGPTLVVTTNVEMADDYELAKAVIDRMMASLVLDPVIGEVPVIPDEPTGPPIAGERVTAEDADGTFRLTLAADQDRYRAGQEIDVMATLTYLGPTDAIVARGSSNPGLIGFSVASTDPPVRINTAFTTDCGPHEMTRGIPVEYPLAKSGGYSPDEPLAPFYAAYFASPELRLPAGTWTITAAGNWYIGDCGASQLYELSASVTVVVEP